MRMLGEQCMPLPVLPALLASPPLRVWHAVEDQFDLEDAIKTVGYVLMTVINVLSVLKF